jgi:hypothetical protein
MVTISAGHHAGNNVHQNTYGITRSHAPAHFTCQPYQGGGLSEETLNILQEKKKGHAISLYTKNNVRITGKDSKYKYELSLIYTYWYLVFIVF